MAHHFRIIRTDTRDVLIGPLDGFCIDLLQSLVAAADPDQHPSSRSRIFPDPSSTDDDINSEWAEFVAPDLETQFIEHLAVIENDLASMEKHRASETFARVAEDAPDDEDSDLPVLHIPADHLDSWVHGLNQARLALHARYGLPDGNDELEIDFNDVPLAFAVGQMHFYGMLLQCLLQVQELDD
jgi:hypothetical protein